MHMSDQQRSHALPMLLQQEKAGSGNQGQDAHHMNLQAAVNHTRSHIDRVQNLQEDQQNLYMSRAKINLPSISPVRASRYVVLLMRWSLDSTLSPEPLWN